EEEGFVLLHPHEEDFPGELKKELMKQRAQQHAREIIANELAVESALDGQTIVFDDSFWDDEPDGDDDWLIHPIIKRGELAVIYGPPKTGKTEIVREASAALATGREFFGRTEGQPARVLYIDFENTRRNVKDQLTILGYTREDDFSALRYELHPNLGALDTKAGGEKLLEMATEHKADLVVIDTLSRVIEGGENDADTFARLYRYSLLPLKRDGIAVLRIDHSGKEADKGQRGSSAKAADVDRVTGIVQMTENKRFLRCEMTRGAPEDNVTLLIDEDTRRHTREDAAFTGPIHDPMGILAFISEKGEVTVKQIRESLSLGDKTVRAELDRIEQAGGLFSSMATPEGGGRPC